MAHVINQISPFTPYMAHLFQRGGFSLHVILSLIHNAPPFEKGRLAGIALKRLSSTAAQGWIALKRLICSDQQIPDTNKNKPDLASASQQT
ncbi:hypothetical protein [Acinetobacter pullicarnis]|uniref:hypothetical protein n=1 Tax=Acinetobacter pullicarnis TaxID=2576829 RepID=UPI0011215CF2|nr:hypothetical protein [Acinetobacter pullicarnis]